MDFQLQTRVTDNEIKMVNRNSCPFSNERESKRIKATKEIKKLIDISLYFLLDNSFNKY